MKLLTISLTTILLLVTFSCKNETGNDTGNINTQKDSVTVNNQNSNSALLPDKNTLKIADSIMYIANVKNTDPESAYYMDQWLAGANTKLLADKIFDAVYNKKLKAYNYTTGEEMSIQDVKDLESEFKRDNIGQILFTEDWYFDENKLKMYKQVNSVMLAYFRYDDKGNLIGNKAGIRVYFNDTKPMRGALDY